MYLKRSSVISGVTLVIRDHLRSFWVTKCLCCPAVLVQLFFGEDVCGIKKWCWSLGESIGMQILEKKKKLEINKFQTQGTLKVAITSYC